MIELLGQFEAASGGFGALIAAAPVLLEYLRSRQASEDRIRYLQTRMRDMESQLAAARKALGNRRALSDTQLMVEVRRRVTKARNQPTDKSREDKPVDLEAALRKLIQELDKEGSR